MRKTTTENRNNLISNKTDHLLVFLFSILLILAIISNTLLCRTLSLILFMLSGLFHGIYYGLRNNNIFHYPYTKDFYREFFSFKSKKEIRKTIEDDKKEVSTGIELYPYKNIPLSNDYALANTLWVHLVCSLVGAFSMYFLINDLSTKQFAVNEFKGTHLILFAIVILGYTGLLPMTLWFFANSGKMLEGLIKR